MNSDFTNNIGNIEYNSTFPETIDDPPYFYGSEPPLPIPETPDFVIAIVVGLFLIFCQEMLKTAFGDEYNILAHLEKKFSTYVKEQLDFYFYNENTITEYDNQCKETSDKDNEIKEYAPKKYEDKYFEEFQKLSNEIVLTEEEQFKEIEQRPASKKDIEKKVESEKDDLRKKIIIVETQLKEINDKENVQKKNEHIKEIKTLNSELKKLNEKEITEEDVNSAAREFIINERFNSLKNNIIMEKTPLGNVVMFYNNSRSSFEYYSDSTIPYRYLEVLGRKYVITYNCKRIYVDMSKEIEEAEKKLAEKKQKEEDEKQKQEEASEKTKLKLGGAAADVQEPQKKNVFAKFKKYNNDTSIKAAAVPLDRPAPAKQTKPQEEKIVKERANRYSFEGKLANFSFLKKVDRKEVDKRYGVSFAEFKKMQQNK